MIGYVMVGTNNLDQSIKFYDELLDILNLERIEKDDVCAGYSQKGGDGKVEFYVTKPVNREKATIGNGCLLYTSPSPRDATLSRMPSSA